MALSPIIRLPGRATHSQPHWFPYESGDITPARAGRRVSAHTIGQVAVVEANGALGEVVEELDLAIRMALAGGPRGVACDLTAVRDCGTPGALRVLATTGRHPRDWPGIPVAVACPDARVREALHAKPLAEHLLVTASMPLALSAVLRTAPAALESLRLTPHPTAPRASRDFVGRTLLDWGLGARIPIACLVVSELVTNAMVHAGSAIEVTITLNTRALRVTVRDQNATPPLQRTADLDLHGQGLALVAGLSRSWGALPAADGGKVVWAVLDASPGQED